MADIKISEDWGNNMVKTTGWFDSNTGDVTMSTFQDIGEIVRKNKADRKAFAIDKNSATGRFGEFAKIASIPNVVVDNLMKSGVWFDRVAFRKWLNDPDNRLFRTIDCNL
jgi:hypothetical protein|tara:strand:- start:477 stop:806 length:330 start_codon:yes stop_codon:yes gene_type:complete